MSTSYPAEPETDLELGLIDGPTLPAYTEWDPAVLGEKPGEHHDDPPKYVEFNAGIMHPVITLPPATHLPSSSTSSPSTSSPSIPSNGSTPSKPTTKAPRARKVKKTAAESDRTLSLCTRALIAVGLCIGIGVLASKLVILAAPKEADKQGK
ncbi:hypothetical protein EX30DRAFT_397291 [Ascodesmis nigricans]|uniref:Uncharacterized protein n=1 Tax=Ascodesmis nigricans TaxID=341454 RepID=A0A4S2MPY0_9PEZI|nr:hypothetical protein EX30DRAFT_397291 [Ascodesmis nigricans]